MSRKRNTMPKLTLAVLLAVAVILLAFLVAWLIDELHAPGTPGGTPPVQGTTSSTTLGSDTPTGAEEIVAYVRNCIFQMRMGQTLPVEANGQTVEVDLNSAGAPVDFGALEVYMDANGLDSGLVSRYRTILDAREEPEYVLNVAYITEKLEKLAENADTGRDTTYTLGEGSVTFLRGVDHVVFDMDAAKTRIVDALLAKTYGKLQLQITTAPYQNPSLEEIRSQLAYPAQDARYDVDEKRNTIIVPEQDGRELDTVAIETELKTGTWAEKTFYTYVVKPEITADHVGDGLFQDLLAQGWTKYNPQKVERTTNLKLAAAAIDGVIVLPGQTFSFNRVVGERTAEKGYLPAAIYTDSPSGMLDELGGGICQNASTLYFVSIHAEMKQISRYEHGYTVSYIRKGLDTTVYWGSLDYVFENNSKYPIKIEMYCNDAEGKLYCKMYGTKPESQVNREVSFREQLIETYQQDTVYKLNPDLAPNQVKQTSYGQAGALYYVYKVVKIDGIIISETKFSTSKYSPMNAVCEAGTEAYAAWLASRQND